MNNNSVHHIPNLTSPISLEQQKKTWQTIAYTLQNVSYSVSITFTGRDIMDLTSTQVSAALLGIPVIGTSLRLDGFDGHFLTLSWDLCTKCLQS